jgi:hypothetical protein
MSLASCCVEDPGDEVPVVDDDLPVAHHQRDLAGAVVRDVGDDALLRAPRRGSGLGRGRTGDDADGSYGRSCAGDGEELPPARLP